MNDEFFQRWLQRTNAEAPPDFAERVMANVRREPPPARGALVLPLASPAVRVAACLLASIAFLYRMAAVVAVFFAQ